MVGPTQRVNLFSLQRINKFRTSAAVAVATNAILGCGTVSFSVVKNMFVIKYYKFL